MEKIKYDDYLAISAFNLLSYSVGVVTQLCEHCDFFRLKYVRHHTNTYNYHMICIVHTSRCDDDVVICILWITLCALAYVGTTIISCTLYSVLCCTVHTISIDHNFPSLILFLPHKKNISMLLMLVVVNDDNSQAPLSSYSLRSCGPTNLLFSFLCFSTVRDDLSTLSFDFACVEHFTACQQPTANLATYAR